ncbi:MAG TPA: hypothetical protein VJO16_06165 [Candidatus Acidoferrum sp.]|nr:hypothetical protein [Candidatus Acidoferrum sp.]
MNKGNHQGFSIVCRMLSVAVLLSANSVRAEAIQDQQDKDSAGVVFSKQATPKEVGLPLYPGAKLHKDEKDDSASVRMGLWGGSFGFKLAVMKMESSDPPEKIAEFYKKALAKYGAVLNCSDPSQKTGTKDKSESSNKLECDDDKPGKGGLVFKAGTKEKEHVVAIQANGAGSLFQLVYVEARGDDKDKKPI